MSSSDHQNIRVYNRNLGTFEEAEAPMFDPNDNRLTDLLLGGLMGYSLFKGQNSASHNMPYAYAQAPQQMPQQQMPQQQMPQQPQMAPQPRIPYPPNFVPNTQQQTPIANLVQAQAYVNRYFYFWPTDDHNLGFWIFVTYIDGMGVRGFHFNGQTFTQVTVSPTTLKAFFVY